MPARGPCQHSFRVESCQGRLGERPGWLRCCAQSLHIRRRLSKVLYVSTGIHF